MKMRESAPLRVLLSSVTCLALLNGCGDSGSAPALVLQPLTSDQKETVIQFMKSVDRLEDAVLSVASRGSSSPGEASHPGYRLRKRVVEDCRFEKQGENTDSRSLRSSGARCPIDFASTQTRTRASNQSSRSVGQVEYRVKDSELAASEDILEFSAKVVRVGGATRGAQVVIESESSGSGWIVSKRLGKIEATQLEIERSVFPSDAVSEDFKSVDVMKLVETSREENEIYRFSSFAVQFTERTRNKVHQYFVNNEEVTAEEFRRLKGRE
jgi:hypothetical protein